MTKPACIDCANATAQLWHGFRASCQGCAARMVARSQPHGQAKKAGRVTADYRRVLALAGVSHEDVKAAAETDVLMQGGK